MTMATELGAGSEVSIDPAARIGAVRLTVADLDRSRSFYETAIGLRAVEQDDGSLAFGPAADEPLVELHGDSNAHALDRRATGLFHFAILVG